MSTMLAAAAPLLDDDSYFDVPERRFSKVGLVPFPRVGRSMPAVNG